MKQLIKSIFDIKYIKLKNITLEIKQYLDNILQKYPNFKNYQNIIKAILLDINFDDYTCIKCNKKFSFNINNKTKICPICRMKVTLKSQEVQNKRKNTCLSKYGVDHPWKSQIIKKNIRNTNLKKYGVPITSQNNEVKEKAKITCNKKYNGNSPMHCNKVKEKLANTMLQKYGIDNYFKYYFNKETDNFSDMRKQQLWNTILSYKDYIFPLFNKEDLNKFNSRKIYKWKCVKCGNIFETYIHKTMHIKKFPYLPRCLNCYPYLNGFSELEKQLVQFCKQYYPNLLENDRELIKPLELDIVIPEIKLAIEFNGNFWHSLEYIKDKNYHLNKVLKVNQVGYRLIHIWQDQWNNRRQQIKNKLRDIFCRRQIFNFRQDKIELDRSWYNNVNILNYELVQQIQPKGIERAGFIVFDCGCLIYRKINN